MAVSGADVEKIKEGIGYGIPPKNAENLIATGFGGKAQLSWTIGDTEINGQVICTLKGCMIRKKQGSAPQSLDDGTLVANLNREQAMSYSEVPYEDPQSIGTSSDWYYRLFFYSDHDVFNLDDRNIVKVRGTSRVKVWGFRQDFSNLNPDSQITYIEDNVGFTPANHSVANSMTNGSWNNWEWMQDNLPYGVSFTTGKSIGALKKTQTSVFEDGRATQFDGLRMGYFAWIPKMYWKESYSGKTRTVKFSLTNRQPGTTDFKLPDFFRNQNGEELEGMWLPIFPAGNIGNWSAHASYYAYSTANNRIAIPFGSTSNSGGFAPQSGVANARAFVNDLRAMAGERFCLLGGSFFCFMRDIFYLIYKTTNLSAKYGSGLDWSFDYGSGISGFVQPNNSYLEGRFSPSTYAFYSRIFNGFGKALFDPYVYFDAENSWGTWKGWVGNFPEYELDDTLVKQKYKLTGLTHQGGNGNLYHLAEMGFVDGFGSIVKKSTVGNASATTGLCACGSFYSSRGYAHWRINKEDVTKNNLCSINTISNNTAGIVVCSFFPPVGYKPN